MLKLVQAMKKVTGAGEWVPILYEWQVLSALTLGCNISYQRASTFGTPFISMLCATYKNSNHAFHAAGGVYCPKAQRLWTACLLRQGDQKV